MHIIGNIRTYYPTFTKSEKIVADYILTHDSHEIDAVTLSDLSETLSIGEATIVRFCRKIHLKGYQELKFLLEIESEKENPNDIDKHEAIKTNLIHSINMSDSMLHQKDIDEAVTLIHHAEEIFFFGVGTSGLSAAMGETRLFRFGKRTKVLSESHVQCMQASLCTEKSLIIALSVSGETKDLLEALVVAKTNQCKIIAITNHVRSSVAKLSDKVFISYGATNILHAGTFSSMVSQMFILDILTSRYALQYPKLATASREKTARVMINKTRDR